MGKQSVSQLVGQIKNLLEGEFQSVHVEAEVSNLSSSFAGHWYFTLSDADSSLSCALFKADAMRNSMIRSLKDGQKVIASGDIGVYSKKGSFQLIVKRLVDAGAGDLKEQFERLKKKLAQEGLFDPSKKRPIPTHVKTVAIITALQGAALADFLNIYKRRAMNMDILIIPSLVQGEAAPASLILALDKAIQYHQKVQSLDVIVLARGGGSMEDLWAFNDEKLARKLATCPVPTINAVGHQVDFTICDFVADLRAETPSAAAELLTNDQLKPALRFNQLSQRLKRQGMAFLNDYKSRLAHVSPTMMASFLYQKLNLERKKLERLNILPRLRQLTKVQDWQIRLDFALKELESRLSHFLPDKLAKLKSLNEMLRVMSPHNVLKRGYSYVMTEDKKLVSDSRNFSKLSQGDKLKLIFHDGEGRVEKIN